MSKEKNRERLQQIINFIDTSNRIRDHRKLLESCDEGIKIADNLRDYATQAYLMARKALCLSLETSSCIYEKQNIVLSRDWIGFSLEADKKRYKNLTNGIERNRNEAKHLFDKALQVAERLSRPDLKAYILMFLGEDYGARYLDYKIEHIARKPRSYLYRYRLIKYFKLDDYLIFDRNDRRRMKECLFLCKKNLLRAADLFGSLGNKINKAYALYNLANQLRTANKFKEARKYLAQSKIIAEECSDVDLLSEKIGEMEKRIKSRNRDIPNYIKGESR